MEAHDTARRHQVAVIAGQRSSLLDAHDDGTVVAGVLPNASADLDASQNACELRGRPVDQGYD